MVEVYNGHTTTEYLQFYRERPQEILIETVGPCNLRCIGCPQTMKEYQDKKWKPAFMDMKLYTSILLQVSRLWKPINVGLYHTGEITLLPHERFAEVVTLAKSYLRDEEGWDSVGFYTNGLNLDETRRKWIVKAGINWVRLSFDGGTKEAYEKVRVGSHFETVLENARQLAKLVKESGKKMRLEVIFVPYKDNEASISEFHNLWRDSGWSASTGGAMNYGGLMEDAVKDRKHTYQYKIRPRHKIPCPRIFEQFTVLVDGRVSLCSADPMGKFELGDLNKQTIEQIWMGERHIQAIANHLNTGEAKIHPCDVCDYTEACGTPRGEYFGELHA